MLVLPSGYHNRRLEQDNVLSHEAALREDFRELYIGLLNLMPDKAFLQTEIDFLQFLKHGSSTIQVYPQFLHIPGIVRKGEAAEHAQKFYQNNVMGFIHKHGLDGLIITGLDPSTSLFKKQTFDPAFRELLEILEKKVTSTFYSCWSAYEVLKVKYEIEKVLRNEKLHGVFSHRPVKTETNHPLNLGMDDEFLAVHSRLNGINASELQKNKLRVLSTINGADEWFLATDKFASDVFCQGHPEYQKSALLGEFIRDLKKRETHPTNYFSAEIAQQVDRIIAGEKDLGQKKNEIGSAAGPTLLNRWRSMEVALAAYFIGLIYQTTNLDRHQKYENPDNPWEKYDSQKSGRGR